MVAVPPTPEWTEKNGRATRKRGRRRGARGGARWNCGLWGGGGIRGILWGDDASPRRWSVMGCCAGDASFLSREGRGELDIFLAEFYLLLFEIGNSSGNRVVFLCE